MRTTTDTPPIIIVGAARSGTKLLRRIIGLHPGIAEIPYDINYVWRTGNHDRTDDELPVAAARPEVVAFIRAYFERSRRGESASQVVEKTVSNTLRVPFVRAVFPDCRLVHLIRDGRDVAASARRQWQAGVDWRSLWPKLRTFPLRTAYSYAWQYAHNYGRRLLGHHASVRSWGPRFLGLDEAVRTRPLLDVCALQWSRSVESSLAALADQPCGGHLELRFEELVREPQEQVERLQTFLELPGTPAVDRFLRTGVDAGAIGKWRRLLDAEEQRRVDEIVRPLNSSLGYD